MYDNIFTSRQANPIRTDRRGELVDSLDYLPPPTPTESRQALSGPAIIPLHWATAQQLVRETNESYDVFISLSL